MANLHRASKNLLWNIDFEDLIEISCSCRVGLELPTIEVRFEDINVEAQVYVGSRALPTLLNFFVNVLEVIQHCKECFLIYQWIAVIYIWFFILYCFFLVKGCLNSLHIIPSPKKQLHILQNVSGIIKPRRWIRNNFSFCVYFSILR